LRAEDLRLLEPRIHAALECVAEWWIAVVPEIHVVNSALVKKNARILRNLRDWLRNLTPSGSDTIPNAPVLLIDDEADYGSVDTNRPRNGNQSDPEHDPTAINICVRELLGVFDQSAYVAYTATPFANIFIDGDTVTGIIDWCEASQGDALFDLATLTLAHHEHLEDVIAGYGVDVDRSLVRAWWSWRCLVAVRWLFENGYGPPEQYPEVAVLRSLA
jgi:hypothetical protein